MTIIVLKRPSRSAIQPGSVRPNIEAALRMETRYPARPADIP